MRTFMRIVVIGSILALLGVVKDALSVPPPGIVPPPTQQEINEAMAEGRGVEFHGGVPRITRGGRRQPHGSSGQRRRLPRKVRFLRLRNAAVVYSLLFSLIGAFAVFVLALNPFGTTARQWARMTAAKIAVSTVVHGAGDLLTDETGNLYVGDGSSMIKALTRVMRIGEVVKRPEDFGADPTGAADSFAAVTAAIAALPSYGGIVFFHGGVYLTSASIVLGTLTRLNGSGSSATTIKLANGANCDAIQTVSCATLSGSNKWLVSDGVPYGMSVNNLSVDGNKANNSSGNGIRAYAKRFPIYDVIVHDCAQNGLLTEGANASGQAQTDDLPETEIGLFWARNNGNHGIYFRGPHDAHMGAVYTVLNGNCGLYVESISGQFGGLCDIAFVHSYGNTVDGVVLLAPVDVSKMITESNGARGLYAASTFISTRIDSLYAFGNQNATPGAAAQSATNVEISGSQVTIGLATIRCDNGGTGLKASAAITSSLHLAITTLNVDGRAKNTIGVDIESNNVTITSGDLHDCSATGGLGLQVAAGVAQVDVKALIQANATQVSYLGGVNRCTFRLRGFLSGEVGWTGTYPDPANGNIVEHRFGGTGTGLDQNSALAGSSWNTGHFVLGSFHVWFDANHNLRFKFGAPASDFDGWGAPVVIEIEQFAGATPDLQLSAAITALLGTGGQIRLRPGVTYVMAAAVPTVDFSLNPAKPIRIKAAEAIVTANFAGPILSAQQTLAPATVRSFRIKGGDWTNSHASGEIVRLTDSSNNRFEQMRVHVGGGAAAFRQINTKFWSERNHYYEIDDNSCQRVISFEVTFRTVSATVTSGSSTVLCADAIAQDAGAPIDNTSSGIPANTFVGTVTPGVSFTLVAADLVTPVNATGNASTVSIWGNASMARTVIRDMSLQGGSNGVCKIDIPDGNRVTASVYDSVIDGLQGNLSAGVVVLKLTGSMNGTEIGNLQTECSGGTGYYFLLGTMSGLAPTFRGKMPTCTSHNMALFSTSPPASAMPFLANWFPDGAALTGALLLNKLSSTLASNGGLTFFVTRANAISVTLQANLTSLTISGQPTIPDGLSGIMSPTQTLLIQLTQDATGGRTYVWPTNLDFGDILPPNDTSPNAVIYAFCYWDNGTNKWRVISAKVSGGAATQLVRTVDGSGGEVVTNSITPVVDDVLTRRVEASSTYHFEIEFQYDATVTGDLLFGLSSPSGSSGWWIPGGVGTAAAGSTSAASLGRLLIGTNAALGGIGAGSVLAVRAVGILITGVNAGVFAPKYAQNVAEASSVTPRAGSWMKVERAA